MHACECAVNTVRCYELKNAQNLSANCWWFTCFTVTIKSLFIFSWRNASAIPSTTYFIYTRVTHSLVERSKISFVDDISHSCAHSSFHKLTCDLFAITHELHLAIKLIAKINLSKSRSIIASHEKRDKHTKVANNNFCAQHDREINELYSNEYRSRLC